jgi:hypothetical protein
VTGRAWLAPAVVLLALAPGGCEYFRDTPEQELANRRWRECAGSLRDVKLERVDPDGRIRFSYAAGNERDQVTACLAAAAGDRKLPEALGSPTAGK